MSNFCNLKKQTKLSDFNSIKTFSHTQNCLKYSKNETIAFDKKAKNKRYFDLSNYSNNNIFIDNNISINDSNIIINDNKPYPTKKSNIYKSSAIVNKKLLIENEKKNLLILENQNKYPIIIYRHNINRRPIKSSYDSYSDDKFDCSVNQYNKSTFNKRNIIDFNKEPKDNYFLQNQIKNCFLKCNEFLTTDNNSNVYNGINSNIDINDYNKDKTFGKKDNLYNSEKEHQVNKIVFKLMDGYLNKLLQLFIERMKTFLKKNILQEFFKIINEYIEIKEENISKHRKNKFTDKEIFNKNSHISFSIYNSHEINKGKDFTNYTNNPNIIFKKKFIFHNDNTQKKYNFNSLNNSINKKGSKTKNAFRKKFSYPSKTNILKTHINSNSNNKNYDIDFENKIKINNLDIFVNHNNFHIKNILQSKIITKKSPKYKFLHTKKQSYDSHTYFLKNNYLSENLQKTIQKKKSNLSNNIKAKEIFKYISSDNKIHITTKYYIYIPKIKFIKNIGPKMNHFHKNLLKIINNHNFYYLFETRENNNNKKNYTSKINCKNLGNSINKKNIESFNNSEKINKGIILLQNLINKNYEENFNNSVNDVEIELENNYSKKEEKGKNNIINRIGKEQTKTNINSKLIKIITFIENKKNKKLLKNYFNNFHSLLNSKIKKQLIVKKLEIHRRVQKTISSNTIKNDPIFFEDKSVEKHDNSKSKNTGCISPLNFDEIKNVGNFNENIEKTDSDNIKLENELNDYSSIPMSSNPKLYSSRKINELIKNKDESFYKYYHKFQDFIFSFRSLLIIYYLNKKNSDQD